MAIDASIYSNVQSPKINIPNPLDTAQQAMSLSQLGMQQAQMAQAIRTQQASRQAYQDNTDPQTGQLDRQGFLSQLAQANPMAAQEQRVSFAQQDESIAKAQSTQLDNAQKTLSITGPAFDYLAKMPEAQRADAYSGVVQQLKDQGINTSTVDHPYDPSLFKQYYNTWQQSKPALENQLTQAQIGKTQSETGQVAQKRLQDYQKSMQDDEEYKSATKTLTQGNGVMASIDDATKNPQSKAAIALQLARLTPDGTRLPADEIQKQALAGTFGDKIKQMVSDTTVGTLNPQEADYMRQFAVTQMNSAAQNKAARSKEYAGQYSQDTGIDPNVSYRQLTATNPGTTAKVPQGPAIFQNKQAAGSASQNQSSPQSTNARDAAALQALKTMDPGSPKAFQLRSILKSKGLVQ